MAEPLASSAAAPAHRETAQWPPAWLTNVGVVIGIGLVVLLSSLAIAAPATTMTEHGVSVDDFQSAGTSADAEQAYDGLGQDGRRAAWWFLGFELPFLASFGLLLCAGCAFAARQLNAAGAGRLARAAGFAVAFGLLSSLSDLIQNSALAVVCLRRGVACRGAAVPTSGYAIGPETRGFEPHQPLRIESLQSGEVLRADMSKCPGGAQNAPGGHRGQRRRPTGRRARCPAPRYD